MQIDPLAMRTLLAMAAVLICVAVAGLFLLSIGSANTAHREGHDDAR